MSDKKSVVMVIEDDATLNRAYSTILTSAGYRATSATNGQEALDLLASQDVDPDLIFLDLRMPVMDGVGFLRNYKPAEEHPSVTIVVFSNFDAEKEVDEAFSLGASRYVLKAWTSPEEFLRIVQDTLGTKKSS